MRSRLACVVVAALLATPAMAQNAAAPTVTEDLDLSKVTCQQFIADSSDKVTTIMAWLEGFYTNENSPPIMYAAKTAKDAKNLVDYCGSHSGDNMITAADAVIPVE